MSRLKALLAALLPALGSGRELLVMVGLEGGCLSSCWAGACPPACGGDALCGGHAAAVGIETAALDMGCSACSGVCGSNTGASGAAP